MAAQRKYPVELRERATRLAVEARREPATRVGVYKRIGDQLGVHPEALRLGSSRPGWTTAWRRARARLMRSGSLSWSVRCVSCAGRTRF